MTERKFVKFGELTDGTMKVSNHKGEYLGYLSFMGQWRVHKQWVFNADSDTFYTEGCLAEIMGKLNQLNSKRGKI
jgi:hypothetical protein